MMKVAILSTSDMGGAGIAAKNLHLSLLKKNIESTFVSKVAAGEAFERHVLMNQPSLSLAQRIKRSVFSRIGMDNNLEKYYLSGRSKEFEYFSLPWSDLEPGREGTITSADIIHLHWVADRFIDYKKIFRLNNKKFVWTLHDMNPFTGGCHHSDGSVKFEATCNYCHQLKGTPDEYLSGKIHRYKAEALQHISDDQVVIVTPSEWLGNLSKRSSLFKRFEHRVIPNPVLLPPSVIERNEIRRKHGFGETDIVLLFVAHHFDNPRKGISILLKALEKIKHPHIRLATVGQKSPGFHSAPGMKQFGFVTDASVMKELYTAADAFILPSVAENFPNTIVEALLCGTPVIASRVGGIVEQVNEKNGLLASPGNVQEWENSLLTFITNRNAYNREGIRKDAELKYDHNKITDTYISLYNRLLQGQ